MRKPTVPEVLPLVNAFYAIDGNGAGGVLHIVLDDGNLHDDHVRSCLEFAEKWGDHRGAALARLLLAMSRTQRGKLAAANVGYQRVEGAEALFDRLLVEVLEATG